MSEKPNLFGIFLNRRSSESHQTCLFGRVATEEDEVNESIFDRRSEIRNDRLVSLLSPFPDIKEFIEVEENKEVMGIGA